MSANLRRGQQPPITTPGTPRLPRDPNPPQTGADDITPPVIGGPGRKKYILY